MLIKFEVGGDMTVSFSRDYDLLDAGKPYVCVEIEIDTDTQHEYRELRIPYKDWGDVIAAVGKPDPETLAQLARQRRNKKKRDDRLR